MSLHSLGCIPFIPLQLSRVLFSYLLKWIRIRSQPYFIITRAMGQWISKLIGMLAVLGSRKLTTLSPTHFVAGNTITVQVSASDGNDNGSATSGSYIVTIAPNCLTYNSVTLANRFGYHPNRSFTIIRVLGHLTSKSTGMSVETGCKVI